MIISRTEAAFLITQLIVMAVAGFSLWFKISLPITYYLMILSLAIIFLLQLEFTKKRRTSFFIFSLILAVLFMRNVYYIATNYSIIPFGDGNWDYGVVKTFLSEGQAYVINEQNPELVLLNWYSGWPLLHILAVCLYQVSGINAYQVALFLPSVIGTCSLAFVYLLIDKMRKFLKLSSEVTGLALFLYSVSPEALFWTIQFVRQNLGILFLVITLYFFYRSWTKPEDRKYQVLTAFSAITLIMVHHFTSFVLVLYLLLFSVLLILGKYLSRTRFGKRLFWELPNVAVARMLSGLGLISLVFLFAWWSDYGTTIWPTVTSGITRFVRILTGIMQIEYLPSAASYPIVLTPMWVRTMAILRDAFIYVAAILGLIVVIMKFSNTPHKFFVTYSTLIFGLIFVIDNFVFRQETYRLITLALPFLSLLGAILYEYAKNKLKWTKHIPVISLIMAFLLFYSFIGLWGHSFAPLHLYDPSINAIEVGERNTDFVRAGKFFVEAIPIDRFQIIGVDDYAPLIRFLNTSDYSKILRLNSEYVESEPSSNELIGAFKDLFIYVYYGRGFSLIKDPQESSQVRYQLYDRLAEQHNRIYDDGRYRFWVSER